MIYRSNVTTDHVDSRIAPFMLLPVVKSKRVNVCNEMKKLKIMSERKEKMTAAKDY